MIEHEEKRYEYLVQIGTEKGTSFHAAVTRLPEPGEEITDWIEDECEASRTAGLPSGMLYIKDLDDLALVLFTRVPVKEKKEVPKETPPAVARNLTIVVKDDGDEPEDSEANKEEEE